MLNRMSTALFKPRLLAKFLGDKIYFPFLFLFLIFLIGIAPYSLDLKNGSAIFPNEYEQISQAIYNTQGSVALSDGKIVKTDGYYLKTEYFIYTFGENGPSFMSTVVNIKANEIELYGYGVRLKRISHNLDNFSLNPNADKDDIFNFSHLVYNFVKEAETNVKIAYATYTFVIELFQMLMLILLFYIVGAFINPIVKQRFRLYYIIYSLCAYFIFKSFSLLFGIELLSYIGLVYSFVIYYKALKAIVKIEVRKG